MSSKSSTTSPGRDDVPATKRAKISELIVTTNGEESVNDRSLVKELQDDVVKGKKEDRDAN